MNAEELNEGIEEVSLYLSVAEQDLACLMRESGIDRDSPVRQKIFEIRTRIIDIIDELESVEEDISGMSEPPEPPKSPRKIEFVSYDGKWPNLCRGKLTIKVDGIEQEFEYCLCSGGSACCGFDGENDIVTQGDWTLEEDKFSEFSDEELKVIAKLVNDNVPHGCCGGCL